MGKIILDQVDDIFMYGPYGFIIILRHNFTRNFPTYLSPHKNFSKKTLATRIPPTKTPVHTK